MKLSGFKDIMEVHKKKNETDIAIFGKSIGNGYQSQQLLEEKKLCK